jgi:hypothetical protein
MEQILVKPKLSISSFIKMKCKHCGVEYMYIDEDKFRNKFLVCINCARDHNIKGELIHAKEPVDTRIKEYPFAGEYGRHSSRVYLPSIR